jgi:hypothetical protein
MTMDELADACQAYEEGRGEELEWDSFNARRICFFMGNHKAKRPEDLWKLKLDDDLTKARMKELRDWQAAVEEARKKREQNG